jgi:hypothetical protein
MEKQISTLILFQELEEELMFLLMQKVLLIVKQQEIS